MRSLSKLWSWLRGQPKWRFVAVLALVLVAGALWLRRGGAAGGNGATFAARRGPLDITVIESGSVQALESQDIKCEVRVGYQGTKILKIVEEGYQVTEEDIRTNKALVELDSSELEKQIAQQEIQYQSATAAFTEARQGYEIQLNQNLSDVRAAEQKARFARLDFEKFLGDTLADSIIAKLDLEAVLAAELTNSAAPPAAAPPAPAPAKVRPAAPVGAEPPASTALPGPNGGGADDAEETEAAVIRALGAAAARTAETRSAPTPVPVPPPPRATPMPTNVLTVDFSAYASIDVLGAGEAKQKLRDLEDSLQVARKELGQAEATLGGTKRLFDKGFVTKTDLERDELAAENAQLKVQKAATARDLYLKYEFRKAAEEALSKFVEAMRELNRARQAAVSKLAQAEAKWKSAEAQYGVQTRQRRELQEQLAKCVIPARKPGLVVYGSGGDEGFYYGGEERIREGATVRERQAIITIPDMSKMGVKVKIHESYIKQIKKGQRARVTVDAFPDQPLEAEVVKVGLLPDSQNRWMNPDLKVYLTTLAIPGTHDWLKPGMSAKAEIRVDRLSDVVYVPVQAVVPQADKRVCFVAAGASAAPREVETGLFNNEFMEIRKGLREGERVLLHPPEDAEHGAESERAEKPGGAEKQAKPEAPPAKETRKTALNDASRNRAPAMTGRVAGCGLRGQARGRPRPQELSQARWAAADEGVRAPAFERPARQPEASSAARDRAHGTPPRFRVLDRPLPALRLVV